MKIYSLPCTFNMPVITLESGQEGQLPTIPDILGLSIHRTSHRLIRDRRYAELLHVLEAALKSTLMRASFSIVILTLFDRSGFGELMRVSYVVGTIAKAWEGVGEAFEKVPTSSRVSGGLVDG